MLDIDAMSFLSGEKKSNSVLFEVYIYITPWFNFILKY